MTCSKPVEAFMYALDMESVASGTTWIGGRALKDEEPEKETGCEVT